MDILYARNQCVPKKSKQRVISSPTSFTFSEEKLQKYLCLKTNPIKLTWLILALGPVLQIYSDIIFYVIERHLS